MGYVKVSIFKISAKKYFQKSINSPRYMYFFWEVAIENQGGDVQIPLKFYHKTNTLMDIYVWLT